MSWLALLIMAVAIHNLFNSDRLIEQGCDSYTAEQICDDWFGPE